MKSRFPLPMKTTVTEDGGTATFCFQIPEDYPYFEGHFPGNPIVPAVTQVGWIITAIGLLKGVVVHDYRISRFKFSRPIRPLANVSTVIEYTDGQYTYKIWADGHLCGSGFVVIASDDD